MKMLKIKSVTCLLLSMIMLVSSTTVIYAQSYEMFFNLTSGQTKAGFPHTKADLENKYYVRQIDTEPENASYRTFKYRPVLNGNSSNPTVVGNLISITGNITSRQSASYYSGRVNMTTNYWLQCTASGSQHATRVVGVSGVWTP